MRYYYIISNVFIHGKALGRGYGTCLMLPWELTSKHGGGMPNTLVPPSHREHRVLLNKEESRDFFKILLVKGTGKKQAMFEILRSSLF